MANTIEFVLAGSLAQSRHFKWTRENQSIKYVYSRESLLGRQNAILYLVGAYDSREDWKDIILFAMTRNFKVIDVTNNYSEFKF